jgi:hypothetical protein
MEEKCLLEWSRSGKNFILRKRSVEYNPTDTCRLHLIGIQSDDADPKYYSGNCFDHPSAEYTALVYENCTLTVDRYSERVYRTEEWDECVGNVWETVGLVALGVCTLCICFPICYYLQKKGCVKSAQQSHQEVVDFHHNNMANPTPAPTYKKTTFYSDGSTKVTHTNVL